MLILLIFVIKNAAMNIITALIALYYYILAYQDISVHYFRYFYPHYF